MKRYPNGLVHSPGFLNAVQVQWLLEQARSIARVAPLATPSMPDGTPLKLKVTSAGSWGWWSDRKGYRYVAVHPVTGNPWPPLTTPLLDLCSFALEHVGVRAFDVDSMLINYYPSDGSLGMHVDRSEEDLEAPIVSFSLGADAVFAFGGEERGGKMTELLLASGDLLVQAGDSRRCFHGIKKILPTLTSPIKDGARLNFTFRKVKK